MGLFVLPITTQGNLVCTAGFAVSLMGAGTSTDGVIRCDQPRALDLVSRKGRTKCLGFSF